jgi:hypothetical protein
MVLWTRNSMKGDQVKGDITRYQPRLCKKRRNEESNAIRDRGRNVQTQTNGRGRFYASYAGASGLLKGCASVVLLQR